MCAHAFLLCMCLCVGGQRTCSWSWLSLSTFLWVLVIKLRLSNLCYKWFFLLSLLFDHPPILFWGYTLPNFVYIVDKFSLCSPDFSRFQYTTQPGLNPESHRLNLWDNWHANHNWLEKSPYYLNSWFLTINMRLSNSSSSQRKTYMNYEV